MVASGTSIFGKGKIKNPAGGVDFVIYTLLCRPLICVGMKGSEVPSTNDWISYAGEEQTSKREKIAAREEMRGEIPETNGLTPRSSRLLTP
jgi:hypothetical protein